MLTVLQDLNLLHEAINKVKAILKRHAKKHGRDLSEDQLNYRIK